MGSSLLQQLDGLQEVLMSLAVAMEGAESDEAYKEAETYAPTRTLHFLHSLGYRSDHKVSLQAVWQFDHFLSPQMLY